MFADINDASQYTAQFLDSYYQQRNWLDQETIATGIQEFMLEKLGGQTITMPADKNPEDLSITEIDELMRQKIGDYDAMLQQAVTDFL